MKLNQEEFKNLIKELDRNGVAEIEVEISEYATATQVEENNEYNIVTGDLKHKTYIVYGYGGRFEENEYVVVNKKKLQSLLCY